MAARLAWALKEPKVGNQSRFSPAWEPAEQEKPLQDAVSDAPARSGAYMLGVIGMQGVVRQFEPKLIGYSSNILAGLRAQLKGQSNGYKKRAADHIANAERIPESDFLMGNVAIQNVMCKCAWL